MKNHSALFNGIMTGQCGEKMLVTDHKTGGGSSCNLGSFNLAYYVTLHGKFNFIQFKEDVRASVRILDRIIDVNKYPIPEIEKVSKDVRELGIGVMGYHDMLIKMGLVYGSEEALKFTKCLFKIMNEEAVNESEKISKTLGSFPAFDKIRSGIIQSRRNSFLLSIAPTGSLSIFSNNLS